MKTKTLKTIGLLILLVAICSIANAKVWYVDASASPGGAGDSWAEAFDTIQDAVNAANPLWLICYAPPDQIYVKEGTYTLTSQINLNRVVTLYGGFPSSMADPDLNDRDWQNNQTRINGNSTVRCINVTSHCVIDGFYIQNGYDALSGGGIYYDKGAISCPGIPSNYWLSGTIRNCDFYGNDALTGGAIYLAQTDTSEGSDPRIENCTFSYNTADTGGAIYMLYSAPDIERCTFHHNQSLAPGSLGGGAIGGFSHNYTTDKWTTITNCLFYSNTSNSNGGALAFNQVYPTITNCTFTLNDASGAGGAIHGNSSEGPRLRNCICWGDTPNEMNVNMSNSYLNVSYSDIEGGWTGPGTNNINDDPGFTGNYSLSPSSPCIDTGSNGYAPNEDILENPRPLDGDNDGTATADMGAFEIEFTDVDLVILNVYTDPTIPTINEPVTVKVVVRNQGTTNASAFWLDWYANRTSDPSPGSVGQKYWRIALPAGATVTEEATYTYTTAEDIHMYAQIDTNDEVMETDETNNIYGPRSSRAVDGVPIDFSINHDQHNASMWFGGDDSATKRNVGVGQSITPVRDTKVWQAGFNFSGPFDYAHNPDGTGHQVYLITRVRDSSGTVIYSVGKTVPASFSGGWIMVSMGTLWLDANQTYIFTCYVHEGEYNEMYTGVYGSTSNPWPGETGYHANVLGQPADMISWSNWGTHPYDFNFRMIGQYIEPYPGDYNLNGLVGIGDLATLCNYWLVNDCLMPGWCDRADVNWDSNVQLDDFNILSRYWGQTYWDENFYDILDRDAIASLDAQLSTASIDCSDSTGFGPGKYFIYRTTLGRYGKFIVGDFDQPDMNKLTISWVTYNSNGTVASTGSGEVIRGTYCCGLDSGGETPCSDTGAEFWWNITNDTKRQLTPKNGARFKLLN